MDKSIRINDELPLELIKKIKSDVTKSVPKKKRQQICTDLDFLEAKLKNNVEVEELVNMSRTVDEVVIFLTVAEDYRFWCQYNLDIMNGLNVSDESKELINDIESRHAFQDFHPEDFDRGLYTGTAIILRWILGEGLDDAFNACGISTGNN